ncbi:hypothetical protein SELMODRAFT_407878 [Selaginella moellendorffii]|uniref:Uncharacterized protein n=1 Tax=Selaginella moellendorffii TaxID=88036 RepID=D8R523_SELML|nr:hypothetical protein SELMODRAFT_407878 [Selaginella moellendorffii]
MSGPPMQCQDAAACCGTPETSERGSKGEVFRTLWDLRFQVQVYSSKRLLGFSPFVYVAAGRNEERGKWEAVELCYRRRQDPLEGPTVEFVCGITGGRRLATAFALHLSSTRPKRFVDYTSLRFEIHGRAVKHIRVNVRKAFACKVRELMETTKISHPAFTASADIAKWPSATKYFWDATMVKCKTLLIPLQDT